MISRLSQSFVVYKTISGNNEVSCDDVYTTKLKRRSQSKERILTLK